MQIQLQIGVLNPSSILAISSLALSSSGHPFKESVSLLFFLLDSLYKTPADGVVECRRADPIFHFKNKSQYLNGPV